MATYREAKCRLCRREGGKLFLKGDKCYTGKCPFEKRPMAPGQHGTGRKKVSEYGQQLREKQKVKRIYGVQEGQFREYYEKADRMKGITGENMLSLLERRLDNVVFRLGIGASRAQARQLVNHGHFKKKKKKVNIPSYTVKKGDCFWNIAKDFLINEVHKDEQDYKPTNQEILDLATKFMEDNNYEFDENKFNSEPPLYPGDKLNLAA